MGHVALCRRNEWLLETDAVDRFKLDRSRRPQVARRSPSCDSIAALYRLLRPPVREPGGSLRPFQFAGILSSLTIPACREPQIRPNGPRRTCPMNRAFR